MVRRPDAWGFPARHLCALALAPTLALVSAAPAVAAEPVPVPTAQPGAAGPASAAADPRLAENPDLGRIAAVDPAEAGRLLGDIDRLLGRPAPPRMRSGNPFDLDAADDALLAGNPLLGQVFAHDPAAAVALLERVKAAGAAGAGK